MSATEDKAKSALELWRNATEQWKESAPAKPALCHPWSEADFNRRLETFTSLEHNKSVSLAARGFEFDNVDGTIKCRICAKQMDVADDPTEDRHDRLCPWRGHAFASIKFDSKGLQRTNDKSTIFDETRHALDSLNRITDVMASIRSSGRS